MVCGGVSYLRTRWCGGGVWWCQLPKGPLTPLRGPRVLADLTRLILCACVHFVCPRLCLCPLCVSTSVLLPQDTFQDIHQMQPMQQQQQQPMQQQPPTTRI